MPALRIRVGLVVNPAMRGSRAASSIEGSEAPSAKILMLSSELVLGMAEASADKSLESRKSSTGSQSHFGGGGSGPWHTDNPRISWSLSLGLWAGKCAYWP